MKVFLKWFAGSVLLLLTMALLPTMLSPHGKLHYFEGFVAILIGSLVLASLFCYLQVKFIPKRQKLLMNRIIDAFGSYPVNDSTTRFRVGPLTIYTQLDFQLLLSEHHGYAETIQFHVPQEQIDSLPSYPFKLKMSRCNGMETYLIHQGSSWRIKRAKQKLEKKVGEILFLPLS